MMKPNQIIRLTFCLIGLTCLLSLSLLPDKVMAKPVDTPTSVLSEQGLTTLITVSYDGSDCTDGFCSPQVWSMSPDGRYLIIGAGDEDRLVAGDTNEANDVFVYDQLTDRMEIISVNNQGELGNGWSHFGQISWDGRFVAFTSTSTNLTDKQLSGLQKIFVHDRTTGQTELISVATDGTLPNLECYDPILSSNGNIVAFTSSADNLDIDTFQGIDIFVRDRQSGVTELVSKSTSGVQGRLPPSDPILSADGRYVVFCSPSGLLVDGDTNGVKDVFLRDRQTGITERVSIDYDGSQLSRDSCPPYMISDDGRYVVFNTIAPEITNSDYTSALVKKDRATGQVQTIWVNDYYSESPWINGISSDLRYGLALEGFFQIYRVDLQTGFKQLVTSGIDGESANGESSSPIISGDGRYVLFQSVASNLVYGDNDFYCDPYSGIGESNCRDVFLWDSIGTGSSLISNYATGQPGSFFTITGQNFPVTSTVTIKVNGVLLGNLESDSSGNFSIVVDSSNADEGSYLLEAVAPLSDLKGTVMLSLDTNAPLHTQEDSGIVYSLPQGAARWFLFLPATLR